MKFYEFTLDKKTKQEKITINFPDKKDFQFLKSLQGSIYYYNTNIFMMLHSKQNIYQLIKNGYIEYKKNLIHTVSSIIAENNYLKISCNNIMKYSLMKNYSYTDTSNCYQFGRFDATKIKKINFWKLEDNIIKIPIGFINDFSEIYTIKDKRLKRKFKYTDNEIKNCLGYLKLRNIQIKAIKSCFENTNGIIKAPTGSGKSEIFIAYLKLTKLKAIILTTSIDLAKQTYNRFLQANLDCGLVQGNNINEDHQIVIATIQSSHKLQNNYECVIVDEVHEVSNIHENILSDSNILYRFGFSATPFTKDNLKNMTIKQFLGGIIFEISSEFLQEKNIIAIPYINMLKIKNKDLLNLQNDRDWHIIEKLFIIENKERNNKIIELCKKIKNQKMILVKKIKHGEIIQKMLLKENIKSIFLKGNIKKEERENVLKEYDLNKNKFVLIGSKILFTGINLQNIFNLFYLAGGKSNIEVLQSLGRALRSGTKLTVNIFDFYDEGNFIIENHSKERINLYKKEGFQNITIIE